MQEIKFEFSGGEATITVKGIKGPACQKETKEVQDALGTTTKTTPTPELYEQTKANNQVGL